jgi:hypothetical protein
MRVILPDGRSVDGWEHGSKVVDPLNGGVPFDPLTTPGVRVEPEPVEKPLAHDEKVVESSTSPPSKPCTLADVEAVFARFIPDGDPIPTRVMLATYIANRDLAGDPVWMMFVGGSGVGKTERLMTLAVMPDVVLESSITGPAALLSGTGKKERAKDASGGILRKFPGGKGCLILISRLRSSSSTLISSIVPGASRITSSSRLVLLVFSVRPRSPNRC